MNRGSAGAVQAGAKQREIGGGASPGPLEASIVGAGAAGAGSL